MEGIRALATGFNVLDDSLMNVISAIKLANQERNA